MHKKLFGILAAIIIATCLVSINAFAQPDSITIIHSQPGNLKQEIIQQIENIPKSQIDSVPAIIIEYIYNVDEDYSSNDDWETLTSLNTIFPNVKNLEITGNGLKTVPGSTFEENSWLERITLNSVEILESRAFDKCSSLKSVDMPNLKHIDYAVFRGCSSLTDVNLPNVVYIDKYVFHECTSLKQISLPNAVIIKDSSFTKCSTLQAVNIPNVVYISDYVFNYCYELAYLNMNNVQFIGNCVFGNCSSLKEIKMPNVKHIETQAFMFCENIEKYFFGAEVPTVSVYYSGATFTSPEYHYYGDDPEWATLTIDPDHEPIRISHTENEYLDMFDLSITDYYIEQDNIDTHSVSNQADKYNIDFDNYNFPYYYDPFIIFKYMLWKIAL